MRRNRHMMSTLNVRALPTVLWLIASGALTCGLLAQSADSSKQHKRSARFRVMVVGRAADPCWLFMTDCSTVHCSALPRTAPIPMRCWSSSFKKGAAASVWKHGLARMTIGQLAVRLGDQQV